MGAQCSGRTVVADETFNVHEAGFSFPVRTVKKMGWKRDLPDFRDRVLALPVERASNLPASVDLRKGDFLSFPIYDQGNLGSCTANAIGAGFHFDQLKQGLKDFVPSRLFIYYNERATEGSIGEDSGAYIRDGIKSVNQQGVCSESLWPYAEAKFTVKPSDACYTDALKYKCLEYARVSQTLDDMRACLSAGLPFVFGFTVYDSFYNLTETGEMSMPTWGDSIVGGHAVLCVGYDDERQMFVVRNSWGDSWGDNGYFYMPYAYLSDPNLASDLWVMRNVDGTALPTRAISAHVPSGTPQPAAAAGVQQVLAEAAERREA